MVATFSQAGRPTDANKRLIGIGQGKFICSPWLILGAALASKFVVKLGGQGINFLEIKIKAKRVSTWHEPVIDRLREMKMSTLAIRQNAVVVWLSGRGPPVLSIGSGEAEATIETLRRLKVIAR